MKAILIKLADNCNDDWVGWPSITLISQQTEISRPCVCKKLKLLEKDGWIKRGRRGFCSTIYTLVEEKIDPDGLLKQKQEKKVGKNPSIQKILPSKQRILPSLQQIPEVVSTGDRNHQVNPHEAIKEASAPNPPMILLGGVRSDEVKAPKETPHYLLPS